MLPISAHVLAALPQAVGRPYWAEWSNDGGSTWTRCAIAAGSASVAADRTAEVRYSAGADLVRRWGALRAGAGLEYTQYYDGVFATTSRTATDAIAQVLDR